MTNTLKKWKKLSSKQVFTHPRHNVFIDQIELPNGISTDYIHFGKSYDSAMIISTNNDGRILLQKEYCYPVDDFLYQFPGGLINDNESPQQAAKRELMEEAKITGDFKQIGWMYVNNRRTSNKMFFFVATNLESSPLESDLEENFEDYWLSEEDIEQMIHKNEICNYTALAGWSFYKAYKNSN